MFGSLKSLKACTGTEGDAASLTYYISLWVYDTWAQRVDGQPVIQPKAGAVKSARERVIKLLVDVQVDATHQSTALDIFQ